MWGEVEDGDGGGVARVVSEGFEWPPELLDMLQPGKKVRVFYYPGNVNNQLRHIRAIVDEEYVVYRVWSRHKRRWVYRIEWLYQFNLAWENGRLSAAK